MNHLTEYAKRHFLKEASNVEVAVYSGSKGEEGFITLFFFSDGKPILVAKVARTRRGLERLRHEYTSLRQVSRLLRRSQLEPTIDTPLDLVELDGLGVLFKENKDGILGSKYLRSLFLRKRKTERFLYLSIDWLINFTKQTQELHLNSPDAKQRAIQDLVAGKALPNYARVFIENSSFFVAPTHGELLPANILIDQRRQQVRCILDFENFRMDGLPIADLMGLIISSGTLVFSRNETAIDSMFLQKGWFLSLCSDCIKKFCREFSVDTQAFKEVMPLYSDRAIGLCLKWNKKGKSLQFHQRLKRILIGKKNDILI